MEVNEMSLSEHEKQLEAAANTRDPAGAAICHESVQLPLRFYKQLLQKISKKTETLCLSTIVKIKEIVRFQTGCMRF